MHIIVKKMWENLRNATDTIEKPTPCLREIVISVRYVCIGECEYKENCALDFASGNDEYFIQSNFNFQIEGTNYFVES